MQADEAEHGRQVLTPLRQGGATGSLQAPGGRHRPAQAFGVDLAVMAGLQAEALGIAPQAQHLVVQQADGGRVAGHGGKLMAERDDRAAVGIAVRRRGRQRAVQVRECRQQVFGGIERQADDGMVACRQAVGLVVHDLPGKGAEQRVMQAAAMQLP